MAHPLTSASNTSRNMYWDTSTHPGLDTNMTDRRIELGTAARTWLQRDAGEVAWMVAVTLAGFGVAGMVIYCLGKMFFG